MDSTPLVRAVVTDLDGTIVEAGGSLSTEVGRAMSELAAAHIPLIVATARTPAGLHVLGQSLRHVSTAVCCNGSLGYDPANDRPLWRHELSTAVTAAIISVLIEQLPEAGVGVYDGSGWLLSERYHPARGTWPSGPYRVAGRRELELVPACALSICHSSLSAADTAKILGEAGVQSEQAVLSYAADAILDVAPPGIDKASGVDRALRLSEVDPDDAVVFGDSVNDVSMFHLVKRSVAVANAHESLIAVAARIAEPIEGFARELERLGVISDAATPCEGQSER